MGMYLIMRDTSDNGDAFDNGIDLIMGMYLIMRDTSDNGDAFDNERYI
jgi:hypothetical protein